MATSDCTLSNTWTARQSIGNGWGELNGTRNWLVYYVRFPPYKRDNLSLPYPKIPWRAKTFLSWVGLRGAVPIIFATCPLINNIEGADIIFNIVFFITLISLLVQGTTISFIARKLNLDLPEEKTGNEFGVEIPEELGSQLKEVILTNEMLENGNLLSEMNIPKNTLVMMVKRGKSIIVPNGKLKMEKGDILLCLSGGR